MLCRYAEYINNEKFAELLSENLVLCKLIYNSVT